MNTHYSIEKKKKLAQTIHKISDHAELKQIKNIILKNNPELSITKNSNGYFMQFQNLSTSTYIELEKYITKLEKVRLKQIHNEILQSSENIDEEGILSDGYIKDPKNTKKLRLTNTENHLLNRAKYEKELMKNEGTDDEIRYYDPQIRNTTSSTKAKDDIFIKNTK